MVLHYHKEGGERHESFDLAKDPYEETNRASNNPEDLKRMRARMLQEHKNADAQASKPFKTLEEMVGE